jgi:hypothetical protein
MQTPEVSTYREGVRQPDLEPVEQESVLNRPAVALLAAGAIGFAVGAVIWHQRRSRPSRFASFDRAIEMARSGTVDTVHTLKRRLRDEGYSPDQIEGRARRYLSQVLAAVQNRL